MDPAGRTIWITGASSGIGAALAEALAPLGCRLILSARRMEALQSLAAQCTDMGSEAHVLPLDLSSPASLDEASNKLTEMGWEVDILVNNGGISQRSEAADTPMELDRKIMEVNYFGAIHLTKLVLPGMLSRGKGMVVTIGSLSGKFGWKLRSAYAASKFALQGFFESLRAETADRGIQVMMVIPGRIRTEISRNSLTASGERYDKMDPAQETGIPASLCAQRILRGIRRERKEILIARKEGLMIRIRQWLPALYYRIAARRDPNV